MTRWLQIGSLTLLLALLTACTGFIDRPAAPVRHVVLAWFTDAVTEADIRQIVAETLKLKAIDEVVSVETGRAIASERPIVDDSFDLAVMMRFRSAEDMRRYLVDPRHRQFVETWLKGRVEKLLVYDF